jgi:16S rRNA (guanine966-N2)-methyltransferase
MRVIAGTYRSRVLKSVKGLSLRPTSDRLRETLFNVLGPEVAGSRFVDLFAGTGAIGIEALSRGAAEVIFIEKHAPTAALIRRNLESLEVRSGVAVLAVDVLRGLEMLAAKHRADDAPIDFVFLDPPYAAAGDYLQVLQFLGDANFVAPAGMVIAEHRAKWDLAKKAGSLQCFRVLNQGDAALSFFRKPVLGSNEKSSQNESAE